MNQISPKLSTGTIGELLVQARLLQFGVQSAPPIKDSGNDLISVKGEFFRAIQVKTRTTEPFGLGDLPALYHIVAIVHLIGDGDDLFFDDSDVFLVPRAFLERHSIRYFAAVQEFKISAGLVSDLFK